MPRALLTAAKKFADSSASSFDALGRPNSWQASTFNHTAYNTFACCILRHARDKQTTKSLAEYILRVVNISSIKTVLILGEHPNLDYMVSLFLNLVNTSLSFILYIFLNIFVGRYSNSWVQTLAGRHCGHRLSSQPNLLPCSSPNCSLLCLKVTLHPR
jgi:hypothetical protein